MKKLIITILLCILVLCGCTTKDNRTVIQFASWGSKSEIDIIKPMIEDFEKNNPDIKIDFMHIPQNYFQKIHLLFASNTAPDVIFINNLYLPLYANHLEELYVNRAEFYPQALDALSYEGRLYAIPRDISNLIIYYNKDIFKKKNIKIDENWTFEDFLKIAQKLTDEKLFAINYEDDPYYLLPYLMSEGGSILPDEITKPESKKAIEFYTGLRYKYHVAPLKSEVASATTAQMFLQEHLAMYLSGRWMVPKFREECKFDWDVINFPNGSKGSIVQADASGWAISKSCKHKDEAKRFVDYLSSKQNIEKFASSGLIVPARLDVSINDGKKPEHSQIFIDIIKNSKPTPVVKNYREIINQVKKDLEQISRK